MPSSARVPSPSDKCTSLRLLRRFNNAGVVKALYFDFNVSRVAITSKILMPASVSKYALKPQGHHSIVRGLQLYVSNKQNLADTMLVKLPLSFDSNQKSSFQTLLQRPERCSGRLCNQVGRKRYISGQVGIYHVK